MDEEQVSTDVYEQGTG